MSTDQSTLPPETTYAPPMTINAVRQGVNVPVRQALALAGFAMIALSVPAGFATPNLPVGLPMAVVGVVLLGRNHVWGRQWLETQLARHPGLEKMAPDWLVRVLAGRAKRAALV